MISILSLRDIILRIASAAWQRRYLIVVPILLMPLVGTAIGIVTPRYFTAKTTLLIQEPTSHNPFLQDLAISTRLKDRMDALVEQLRIRKSLQEVLWNLGWINKDTPMSEVEMLTGRLNSNLMFRLTGGEVVEITYRSNVAKGMDKLLTEVSHQFITRLLAPGQTAVDGSEEFLREQLQSKRLELETLERQLADFKSEHADSLPELHIRNVDRLAEVRRFLSDKTSQLAGDRASFASIKMKLVETDPVVGQLDKALVVARTELSILRSRYTDQHSMVKAMLRQVGQLEHERSERVALGRTLLNNDPDRLWNMISSGVAEGQGLVVSQLERLQEAKDQIERLGKEIETLGEEEVVLRERVNAFGMVEQTLTSLQRDVTVLRKIVAQLAERFEMAQVTGSLGRFDSSETVKVVNPPLVPKARTGLPTVFYTVMGLVAGFALGVGLAVVVDISDTTIRTVDHVERIPGLKVLTRLPRVAGYGPTQHTNRRSRLMRFFRQEAKA
ncbi:hypothetical protein [Nisaea sp.]|uniref:GumC family protein n=1 Tax=Nisaea sp. TaxID=2024842 RepID=UPI002B26E76D|nr:hypothetical protein [Nisaea sp.]